MSSKTKFNKINKQRAANFQKRRGFVKPEEFSAGGVAAATLSGASIGSAFPPFGPLITGAVGFGAGLFQHFKEKKAEANAPSGPLAYNPNELYNFDTFNDRYQKYGTFVGDAKHQDQFRMDLDSRQSQADAKANQALVDAREKSLASRDVELQSQAYSPYAPTFPFGGVVPYEEKDYDSPEPLANAELEKGEYYRTPPLPGEQYGRIYAVGQSANTHGEGGEFYDLPEGTEIVGKGTLENGLTAKEVGGKLYAQQQQQLKVLENKPTSTDRETAEMMLAKVDRGYSEIMAQQEQKNNSNVQNPNRLFARRGGVIPKFFGGGISSNDPFAEGFTEDSYTNNLYSQPQQGTANIENALGNQPGLFSTPGAGLSYGIGTAASLFPGIRNLAVGARPSTQLASSSYELPRNYRLQGNYASTADIGNRYGDESLRTLRNRNVNIRPYLESNRQAFADQNYRLRNAGNLTQGQYLGSLQKGAIEKGRRDQEAFAYRDKTLAGYARDLSTMQFYLGRGEATRGLQQDLANQQLAFGKDRSNQQFAYQGDAFNAQQRLNVARTNLQSDAQQRAYSGTGARDVGLAGQMFARNTLQQDRDRQRLALLNDPNGPYKWDPLKGWTFKNQNDA